MEMTKPGPAQEENVTKVRKAKKRGGGGAGNKKRVRRWIILGVIVVVIAVVFYTCSQAGKQAQNILAQSDTLVLSYQDFENSVSATGTVESAKSDYVYSTQSYPVQTLHVKVGDAVNEGDILAELDSSMLQDQIEAKEVATGISAEAAAQQVKTARDSYNSAREALDEGLNASIISAENAVQVAYDNWQKAIRTYNNFRGTDLDDALEQAEDAVDRAQDEYDDATRVASESGLPADIEKRVAAQAALAQAENTLRSVQAQYDSYDETLTEYRYAVDYAHKAYVTAQEQLEAARFGANTQLQGSRNTLSSAEINANMDSATLSLAQMQEDLEETRIKAPAAGTVTAVYAEVGASGAGLLFVIEDTGNLVVETSVKGYDVGAVKVNMPVAIKSDATGDEVFDGRITSIAPTSNKNARGETDTTGDVLFATEVEVLSKDTGLRIGMSVRLNYILARQPGAMLVPYDAIYENANGESCVLLAEQQPDGRYKLRETKVAQGQENDIDVVVTGDEIAPGVMVVTMPDKYMEKLGQELALVDFAAIPGFNAAVGG
ncbi:MAG TPA: efflux RND transporter periplasmic adaptor subunit [Feifaniaceae bacterium]|nr:efflux RND transporter periplasmic adaptor subunit [Feifaniaceae bacterium]